ncbi:MAG: putative acyl-CoA lyase [Frankiales bacterium]|nr:putative acyl-CoA lyase [Frankiales bacterium]
MSAVLRSVLYMPSSNERALEKAKTIAADAIIFDLEDAVAPDAKEAARSNAVAAATSGEYGTKTLTIRCNGLDTPWGASDLEAAAKANPDAIVVPKVSGLAHLEAITAITGDTPIWAMVETPAALFAIREICSYPQVGALVMGTNDLVKELRASMVEGRGPLLPHLALALLGARDAGKTILDGVYNDVKNEAGFRAECLQGKEMGFDGKTLIHPNQVDVTNEVWAPTEAEVEHARKVIEAFAEAESSGKGVVTVDGRMVENLHRDIAQRVLDTAEAIAGL